jgi:uncharacterized membrane protein
MKILTAIFFGYALWIILKASSQFLSLFVKSKSLRSIVLCYYPWAETTLWTAFVFWLIHYFFSAHEQIFLILFSGVTIMLIALTGWYVIRDIVAGTTLKSDFELEKGDKVVAGEYSGIISLLGAVSLEITAADGEKHRLRYSGILSGTFSKITEKRKEKTHSIRLLIPMHYGAQNIERVLNRKLLEIPWILAESDIKIQLTAAGDFYETLISFSTLKEDMFNKTEEILQTYTHSVFNPEWNQQ